MWNASNKLVVILLFLKYTLFFIEVLSLQLTEQKVW